MNTYICTEDHRCMGKFPKGGTYHPNCPYCSSNVPNWPIFYARKILPYRQTLGPTERKELFTVHRLRHFFLPHQKLVFWLFEGKFSFFKKYMNFSRSRTNLQGQDCSHRKALSYQYAMFWIILYCYCGCHRLYCSDHAKQMAAFPVI